MSAQNGFVDPVGKLIFNIVSVVLLDGSRRICFESVLNYSLFPHEFLPACNTTRLTGQVKI